MPDAARDAKRKAAPKATRKATPKATAAAVPNGQTRAAQTRASLDADIATLHRGALVFTQLTLPQRVTLLRRIRDAVVLAAPEWADTAADSKGLGPQHPLRGEEWLSGPYAVLGALDGYIATLSALAAGRSPIDGVRTGTAPGGRTVIHAFPATGMDRVLLSGFTGEIWLRPGVDAAQARRTAGLAQRHPDQNAGVGLVLGAGNITSIPVLDVLYELLAAGRVSLLKVNPTQDALVPVFTRALLPLVELGMLRIVRGGGDVGAYLTQHKGIDHVHITGSATTFDAIVWGTGGAATRRKNTGKPKLSVPITAELGGVSPIIVVPGPWTDADLAYQASHIATMRLHNSGHNCIAGQVVIISADWPQRDAFLAALRTAYESAPERPVWYPHADERLDAASAAYPNAQWNPSHTRALVHTGDTVDASAIETVEYFAPVLGVVDLPGTGSEFVDRAIAHANEKLAGTLGANVLIDPQTEGELGEAFTQALGDLHYGGIAVNAWTGVLFATPVLSWGAYPGADASDVRSGIGIVHNTLLVTDVERSVLRGPFRPFPRSLPARLRGGKNRFSILPKPPWFVDARTSTEVAEGLTRWHMDHRIAGLMRTLATAMRA